MKNGTRLLVDHTKCVGSTICTQIGSTVFAPNQEGQSIVVNANSDSTERILEVVEGCPVGAIVIDDVGTGRQVLP